MFVLFENTQEVVPVERLKHMKSKSDYPFMKQCNNEYINEYIRSQYLIFYLLKFREPLNGTF